MYPILYQNQSLQDVHLSSLVAIGLPAFSLCHLATTLAIQWRSWCLVTSGGGRLRPINFSTSPPTVAPKSGKPHALTSGQSADRLDNLYCVRISKWEYTFQVTYVLVATMSFHLNRWCHRYGGAEPCSEKGKCGSQYQDLSRYLLHDFNLEGHNITIKYHIFFLISINFIIINYISQLVKSMNLFCLACMKLLLYFFIMISIWRFWRKNFYSFNFRIWNLREKV